jgi:GMP synthase (glutamine-hydrolysing)
MADPSRSLYALLFHQKSSTPIAVSDSRNYAYNICGCTGDWTMASFVEEATARIKTQVGSGRVVCGLSGGVDSTVAALLIHRAVGSQLTCIFVDNGVLRLNEAAQIRKRFERLNLPLVFADASVMFLDRLKGVTDPEKKRKIIGATFIEVFEAEAAKLGPVDFLAQGTLYPDVIESVPIVGQAASMIKSHHNVGGLPERMRMKLVEPLRELFKDEVRTVGRKLGLDEEFVIRQPFPGPGLAVRILGEVTTERLNLLRRADAVVAEEIKRDGFYAKLWQSFASVTAGAKRRRDGRRADLRVPCGQSKAATG